MKGDQILVYEERGLRFFDAWQVTVDGVTCQRPDRSTARRMIQVFWDGEPSFDSAAWRWQPYRDVDLDLFMRTGEVELR